MYLFLIIFIAFVLIRLGEFVSFFARIKYFRIGATDAKKEKALNLYRIAVRLGGCSKMTKINYAYLALRHGRVEEAESILLKELVTAKKNTDIVSARSTLALVHWKKNEIDEAIVLLEQVLENGANTTAYGSLGHMYNLKGDYTKALEFNKMAMEYAPTDKIIMDNYGTSLYKTGNIEEAKKLYKELVESEPTFPEAYVTYANILKEEGNIGAAQQMLKKALQANFTFLSTISKDDIREMLKEGVINA